MWEGCDDVRECRGVNVCVCVTCMKDFQAYKFVQQMYRHVSSQRASQEEQNGANFSFVAPSSEE